MSNDVQELNFHADRFTDIRWPHECPVCGQTGITSTARFFASHHHSIGLQDNVLLELRRSVEPFVCGRCVYKVHLSRLLGFISFLAKCAVGALLLSLGLWIYLLIENSTYQILWVLACLVNTGMIVSLDCYQPYLTYHRFHKYVFLSFRNPDYATKFRLLNLDR